MDIHKGIANANKLMNRLLIESLGEVDFRIASSTEVDCAMQSPGNHKRSSYWTLQTRRHAKARW